MTILVTGASGFLGSALLPRLLAKGHQIYALSRHPPARDKNLVPVIGDILKPNLDLVKVPKDIDAVYHLAAVHRLDESKAADIWETNVLGTQNVIQFCEERSIPHLYFTSSAYTFARNSYEKTKMLCESMVLSSSIPHTIFKPSVVMPSAGIAYPGHFLQFVVLLVKLHQRAEVIRRYAEGKLRLPIIRPMFRVPGNPDGVLNLIKINDVARAMTEIEDEGTFWLTNPQPPKLRDLANWIGETILLDVRIEPSFKPTPIELTFQKAGAAFLPYLWGDSFKRDIEASPITREFVQAAIKAGLSSIPSFLA